MYGSVRNVWLCTIWSYQQGVPLEGIEADRTGATYCRHRRSKGLDQGIDCRMRRDGTHCSLLGYTVRSISVPKLFVETGRRLNPVHVIPLPLISVTWSKQRPADHAMHLMMQSRYDTGCDMMTKVLLQRACKFPTSRPGPPTSSR